MTDNAELIDRIEGAISLAFEGQGEAWSDKLSGGRLAYVATRAIEGLVTTALAQSESDLADSREDIIRDTEYAHLLRQKIYERAATIEAARTYVEKVRAHGAESIGGGTVYVARLLAILSHTGTTKRGK